ncbi:MAG: FtsX-like permease family protein [Candidatus Heimdallarchaeota archaeon]|nr:MAG: FtsX-like permease family protein [Candidatus Heimdallarchaeota archaeon]
MKGSLRKTLSTRKRQIGLIFGLAKRNATRSKYRSSLLILGIVLTIALETGIVISIDTLYDNFVFNNRNQNYTDISVIPKEWVGLSTLRSITKDVSSVAGVTKASPVYSLPASRLVKEQFPESNVLIYGIDPKTHPDFSTINITEGKRELHDNTIIISHKLFIDSGFRVGDSVDLKDFETDIVLDPSTFKSSRFTIGGVLNDPSFLGNNLGYLFILINIRTLFNIIPQAERPNILRAKIDVYVENLLDLKIIQEKVKDKVGVRSYVWTEKDISDIRSSGIRAYQTAMNLVILASFVVEFLFITNILAIAIRDRSKEFGVLRAVGSSSKQIVLLISVEILLYSIVGSFLGIIGGIGFANIIVGLMQSFYPTLKFQALSLHPSSLLATLASGIAVALISGLYPIFIALSTPVIRNIHSQMRSGKSSFVLLENWKHTIIMGFLLALTGFILQFFVGPTRFLDFEILSLHFFVILLIFIGTVLIEIGILIFLPKVAFAFLSPIFGELVRTISMRNIAREFRKSLFTIMTAALALTFIIVIGLVSAAVITGFPAFFQEQWGNIDLVAEARDDQLPDINLTTSLEQSTPIIKSSFIQEERTEIQGIYSYVYGVDPSQYAFFAEEVIESVNNDTSTSFLSHNQTLGNTTYGLVSRHLFERLLSPVGSNVSVRIGDNSTVNITIGAVIKPNVFLGNGEYLYISADKFSKFYNSTRAKWFVCAVEGNVRSAQTLIEAEFPIFKEVIGIDFYVKTIERTLMFQSAIFQLLFVESFILAAIAQFICILVSTLRMEREMGIMRAMGLSKRGVIDVFMSESVALGLAAIVVGLFDGLIGSILLTWYINLSFPIEIEFPLDRINTWILFSFIITLASTILPSYRSSRKSIVSTISRRPFRKDFVEESIIVKAFHPLWQTSAVKSIFAIYKSQKQSLIAHEEMKAALPFPSTSIRQFIKHNRFRVQLAFLTLVSIITLSILINNYLLVRGLIPFDFLWRFYFSILPIKDFYADYYSPAFLFINPLLLIISLTVITPITYYLVHESPRANPIGLLTSSFAFGTVGLICCLIAPFFLIIFLILIVGPILLFFAGISYMSYSGYFIFIVILTLMVIGLELFLFQKLWAILIFNGLGSELTFGQKIFWLEKIISKGQVKFIGLILIHFLLQSILFFIFESLPQAILAEEYVHFPFSIPYIFSLFPVDPLAFLILTTFEVGFFLLFIIYQIVQFQNQINILYPSILAERVTKKKTIFTIREKDFQHFPSTYGLKRQD